MKGKMYLPVRCGSCAQPCGARLLRNVPLRHNGLLSSRREFSAFPSSSTSSAASCSLLPSVLSASPAVLGTSLGGSVHACGSGALNCQRRWCATTGKNPEDAAASATDIMTSSLPQQQHQQSQTPDADWMDFMFYGDFPTFQSSTHLNDDLNKNNNNVEQQQQQRQGTREDPDSASGALQDSYDIYAEMLAASVTADLAATQESGRFTGFTSQAASLTAAAGEGWPGDENVPIERESRHLLAPDGGFGEDMHANAAGGVEELERIVQREEGLKYMEEAGAVPILRGGSELNRASAGAREEENGEEEEEEDTTADQQFWWLKPELHSGDAAGLSEPAIVPGKDGKFTTPSSLLLQHQQQPQPQPQGDTKEGNANRSLLVAQPIAQMLSSSSFLSRQDCLYLSYPTPTEVRIPNPASLSEGQRKCVMVVFAANDLRVHDNYSLALASMRAHQAGGIPVVAVCVLDYRTFAQPSTVGGFYRQSPMRAKYLLDTVQALRSKLEDWRPLKELPYVEGGEEGDDYPRILEASIPTEKPGSGLGVPLIVRCGRPEEHVPRLAVEFGAVDVFLTTQYAPHERRVHDSIMRRTKTGCWVSRAPLRDDSVVVSGDNKRRGDGDDAGNDDESMRGLDELDDGVMEVMEHAWVAGSSGGHHPYGAEGNVALADAPAVPHSTWQTTLVHLDDLPTPVAAMKEGERWYHDDVTAATIRPTQPYDAYIARLAELPKWHELLPSEDEIAGKEGPSLIRGALPSLEELGYDATALAGPDFRFEEVIATQSSHLGAGEDAALVRVAEWLADGGMTSMLRFGRERRTNTKLYSHRLSRVSQYIAVGALSPRRLYEEIRMFAQQHLRDGFVQSQYREALLRLSRRDYWHWMGLRYGDRLFYSYGPHPEETDAIPEWRRDPKIIQRWCSALTGIPLADAAMRELMGTGFVAHEGRQALAWLLARGYGQDWRIGAEWLERCSLDFDPFVCYGNFAYFSELIHDDFGEPVRTIHYLAHQHDQTGIYVKRWLPQLSKIPPVYIHRPHVLTRRMQAMHGVYLGKTYPFPIKLWQGAQRTLGAEHLTSYFSRNITGTAGYAEALRYGKAVLQPEEWNMAVSPTYVEGRAWAHEYLPASAFDSFKEDSEEEVNVVAGSAARARERVRHADKRM